LAGRVTWFCTSIRRSVGRGYIFDKHILFYFIYIFLKRVECTDWQWRDGRVDGRTDGRNHPAVRGKTLTFFMFCLLWCDGIDSDYRLGTVNPLLARY